MGLLLFKLGTEKGFLCMTQNSELIFKKIILKHMQFFKIHGKKCHVKSKNNWQTEKKYFKGKNYYPYILKIEVQIPNRKKKKKTWSKKFSWKYETNILNV